MPEAQLPVTTIMAAASAKMDKFHFLSIFKKMLDQQYAGAPGDDGDKFYAKLNEVFLMYNN